MTHWDALADTNIADAARHAFGVASTCVFYTNPDLTLREGTLYIAGQNPGGGPSSIPSQRRGTPLDHPQRAADRQDWCKFLDESWDTRYRESSKYLASMCFPGGVAGFRRAFCTNALFMRGRLNSQAVDRAALWNACRPWHIQWIRIAQPRAVICLGNGDASPFAWFKTLLRDVRDMAEIPTYNNFHLKVAAGNFDSRPVTLIGVPSPSRWASASRHSAVALATIRSILRDGGYLQA